MFVLYPFISSHPQLMAGGEEGTTCNMKWSKTCLIEMAIERHFRTGVPECAGVQWRLEAHSSARISVVTEIYLVRSTDAILQWRKQRWNGHRYVSVTPAAGEGQVGRRLARHHGISSLPGFLLSLFLRGFRLALRWCYASVILRKAVPVLLRCWRNSIF